MYIRRKRIYSISYVGSRVLSVSDRIVWQPCSEATSVLWGVKNNYQSTWREKDTFLEGGKWRLSGRSANLISRARWEGRAGGEERPLTGAEVGRRRRRIMGEGALASGGDSVILQQLVKLKLLRRRRYNTVSHWSPVSHWSVGRRALPTDKNLLLFIFSYISEASNVLYSYTVRNSRLVLLVSSATHLVLKSLFQCMSGVVSSVWVE